LQKTSQSLLRIRRWCTPFEKACAIFTELPYFWNWHPGYLFEI